MAGRRRPRRRPGPRRTGRQRRGEGRGHRPGDGPRHRRSPPRPGPGGRGPGGPRRTRRRPRHRRAGRGGLRAHGTRQRIAAALAADDRLAELLGLPALARPSDGVRPGRATPLDAADLDRCAGDPARAAGQQPWPPPNATCSTCAPPPRTTPGSSARSATAACCRRDPTCWPPSSTWASTACPRCPAGATSPRPSTRPTTPTCWPPAPNWSTAWWSPTPAPTGGPARCWRQAALLPRSTVAVGTAAALLAPLPAGGDDDQVFLVPPNPAMHDEQAADGERQAAARQGAAARDEEIRALAARLGHDRDTGRPPAVLARHLPARPTGRTGRRRRRSPGRPPRPRSPRSPTPVPRAPRPTRPARRGRRGPRGAAGGRPAGQAPRRRARRTRPPAARARRLAAPGPRTVRGRGRGPRSTPRPAWPRARAGDEDRRAAQRAADDARRTVRALRAERAEIAGAPDTDLAGGAPPDGLAARAARGVPGRLPALREGGRRRRPAGRTGPRGERRRAPPWPSWTGSPTRCAPAPPDCSRARTAPTARPGRPPPPAPSPSCRRIESRAATASEQLGRLRGEAERLGPRRRRGTHRAARRPGPATTPTTPRRCCATVTTELAGDTDALETAREQHADLPARPPRRRGRHGRLRRDRGPAARPAAGPHPRPR